VDALFRRPILRIVPVALILIALQRTAFETVRPFDVSFQIVLAFAAAAGISGGAERGAWAGFVLGVMFDLGTGAPLGQHALAYGLAGFTAGMVTVVAVDPHWWLKLIFVALGGAVGEFMVPVVQTFVSDGGWQGQRLDRILPVIAVSCAALSYPFVPLGRWCLAIRKKTWKPRNE
jgi:rod shape-determining protein MreD